MGLITKHNLKRLVFQSNFKYPGFGQMRFHEMAAIYCEKVEMDNSELFRMVQRLRLVDLVRFYQRLFVQSALLKCVTDRLCNLEKSEWAKIVYYQCVNAAFLKRFEKYVDWNLVSKVVVFNSQDIWILQDRLNFDVMSRYQNLSEKTILNFANRWDWESISRYQNITELIITQTGHLLKPLVLLQYQKLSEALIRELIKYDRFNTKQTWKVISQYQTLSHLFIEDFYFDLYLFKIITHQKLETETIEFLAESFEKEVTLFPNMEREFLQLIVQHQDVSVEFCSKYSEKIDFERLLKAKPLTETFLDTFKYYFDWKDVVRYQKVSDHFLQRLPNPFHDYTGTVEDVCSVCLGNVEDSVLSNPCKHIFCKKCLKNSLYYNRKCPYCRHVLIAWM